MSEQPQPHQANRQSKQEPARRSLEVVNTSNQLERMRAQAEAERTSMSSEQQTEPKPQDASAEAPKPALSKPRRPEPPIRPHQNRISASPAELKTERQLELEREVIRACRTVFDPEIPVNLYELGLIYDIDIDPEDRVHIRMTLTAPGCPVAGSLVAEVEQKVAAIPEVKDVTVELVWDPPWDREMMSETARVQLDFLF